MNQYKCNIPIFSIQYKNGSTLKKNEYIDFYDIQDKDKVVKLEYNYCNSLEIPSDFSYIFPNLEYVDFSYNNIKKLPNLKICKLHTLLLDQNVIDELPNVFECPNLIILSLNFNKLKNFKISFCPNLYILRISNNLLKKITLNFPKLHTLNISYNKLKSLPHDLYIPELDNLNAENNKLCELTPSINNCEKLITLKLSHNRLKTIPNMYIKNLLTLQIANNQLENISILNFPSLCVLALSLNKLENITIDKIKCEKLKVLKLNKNNINEFPNIKFEELIELDISSNNIEKIPENISDFFPKISIFYCCNCKIKKLPKNMFFKNLSELSLINNQITSIPLCVMNWPSIRMIHIMQNPIDLSPQIARFLTNLSNKYNNIYNNELFVYNDKQNVHNSHIQSSIKESIENITTRTDLDKFNHEKCIDMIINNPYIECKEQLIEYCNNGDIHSLLLLTFEEVLWYVLNTIEKDYDTFTQLEIFKILNQEMKDAECKCFTGRINRLINCLNGFSDLVRIYINDSDQIANIINISKDKLGNDYDVEKHKNIVVSELLDRGYDKDTISEWIEHIE